MILNLTVDGINMLYRALAGDAIVFTKVKLGNGNPQMLDHVTNLANPLLEVSFSTITFNIDHVTLHAAFNNSLVNAGFRMTEAGIYCQNPNNVAEEILYAYAHEPIESANWIAPSNSDVQETQLDFLVFVGNAENVSAAINDSLVYALKSDFLAHSDDHHNPHQVTKDQVGLGNVPNVQTNDQTPTFSPSSNLVNLSSGEKINVLFGKIAKAISTLISHVASRKNPHNITAEQVGAASATHYHSAADINAGILPVTRGGTGKTSYAANLLLFANATNSIGQIARPYGANRFLTQDRLSGAPSFSFASAADTGTYVGDGTYGRGNETLLSFNDRPTPKLIIIIPESGGPEAFIVLPQASSCVGIGAQLSDSFGGCFVTEESDENSSAVKLQSERSASDQANIDGMTYNYVAVF